MSDLEEPLEYGRIADIPRSKARYKALARFHWEFYSELAFQRNQIYEALKGSLRERTKPFAFSAWQRAVKYRYSLSPLSTNGSRSDPGGRFNFGEVDPSRFPVFPALYLASDKGTALAELFGRESRPGDALGPEELALTRSQSVTLVSVSGKLESVLDVRERDSLKGFVELISKFRLSSSLISKAKSLGFPSLPLVRTVEQLQRALHYRDWRAWPMQFDVPFPSQIFGRIALDAGIEGMLFQSALTERVCLVIYPQNFVNSTSYAQLDGPLPAETVQARIDAETFLNFT